MKKNKHTDDQQGVQRRTDPLGQTLEEELRSPEQEPCVDRGERIATGKAIARAGRKTGFVPGAQSEPSRRPSQTDEQ